MSDKDKNQEEKDQKQSLFQKCSALIKENGFLQGILGALSIVATIPNFTSLERYDLLRFLHSVIIGWERVTHNIGALFGVSSFGINLVLFFFFFTIPLCLSIRKMEEFGKGAPYMMIAGGLISLNQYQVLFGWYPDVESSYNFLVVVMNTLRCFICFGNDTVLFRFSDGNHQDLPGLQKGGIRCCRISSYY